MKLIFKSMVSLLVLANLAVAASRDERDPSAAKPVLALPAPGQDFDSMFRAAALNASRAQQQVSALVLAAPKDERLDDLNARIAKVRAKLYERQAQWEEVKGRITGLTMQMRTSDEKDLADLIGNLQDMKFEVKKTGSEETEEVGLAPEKFIGSVESFVSTSASGFKDVVVEVSDEISRTRSNISGLNGVLAELLAELKEYQAKK
jgi:hypothetical protein